MASDRIVPIEMQTLDSSTLAIDAWEPFNVAGMEGALTFIRITNTSNTVIFISYDGDNDHEYIAAGDKISVYFQMNSSPTNYTSKLSKHTVVYARGAAGQGNIYLSGYYNEE